MLNVCCFFSVSDSLHDRHEFDKQGRARIFGVKRVMTGEEMKQAMKSLLESQAGTSAKLALTIEAVNRLAETVERDRRENRELLEAHRLENREQLDAQRELLDEYRHETREAINNLIIGNEVTRDLAERVARLAISTSQRVSALENARED